MIRLLVTLIYQCRTKLRRPAINNLYDVFLNIRDYEAEHIKTMFVCQQSHAKYTLTSPHARENYNLKLP